MKTVYQLLNSSTSRLCTHTSHILWTGCRVRMCSWQCLYFKQQWSDFNMCEEDRENGGQKEKRKQQNIEKVAQKPSLRLLKRKNTR